MGFSPFFDAKNTRKPTGIKGLRVFNTEGEITFTGGERLVVRFASNHKILWVSNADGHKKADSLKKEIGFLSLFQHGVLLVGVGGERLAPQRHDGLGNLHVLHGGAIKHLGAPSVGIDGHVPAGVTATVVLELLVHHVQAAGFVVGGDENKGVGMVESKLHKAGDGLIEAQDGASRILHLQIVAVLVDVGFLVHHKEAFFVLIQSVQGGGDALFQRIHAISGVQIVIRLDEGAVGILQDLLACQNVRGVVAVIRVGGETGRGSARLHLGGHHRRAHTQRAGQLGDGQQILAVLIPTDTAVGGLVSGGEGGSRCRRVGGVLQRVGVGVTAVREHRAVEQTLAVGIVGQLGAVQTLGHGGVHRAHTVTDEQDIVIGLFHDGGVHLCRGGHGGDHVGGGEVGFDEIVSRGGNDEIVRLQRHLFLAAHNGKLQAFQRLVQRLGQVAVGLAHQDFGAAVVGIGVVGDHVQRHAGHLVDAPANIHRGAENVIRSVNGMHDGVLP